MSSTATTTVKTKQRSPSSASQKFWPLKKFGLHHGKTEEQLQQQQEQQQQSNPLSSTKNNKESLPSTSPAENTTNKANKSHDEKNAAVQQKKTKNKRLSSLLSSSRHQEANNFQNLQSHVNTPESIAADNTKKQINNASNTPTLTRKSGREISNRTRTNSQNTTTNTTTTSPQKHHNNMTAKSAGSGTLSRSNNVNSSAITPPSTTAPLNSNKIRTKELRNNSVRRSSEERLLKRPQSPPTKKNDTAQPNIMLDSVQQKIQNEQYVRSTKKDESDVDNDSAIEEDNNESDSDDEKVKIVVNDEKLTPALEAIINKAITEKFDSPPVENNSNNEGVKLQLAELEPDSHEENTGKKEENNKIEDDIVVVVEESKMYGEMQRQQKVRSSLPSPPNTPAATDAMLSEFTKVRDSEANSAAGIVHIHSEPASPTMYTFDVPSMHNYKLNDIDNYNQDSSQSLFTQQQQQSIQRIRRLRPAASFATLRQLASTNNTYQLQQQQQQQHFQSKQQIKTSKRRPVSYIESGNQASFLNYANDEYLTVNRPNYYRRASSEDNRYFHTREQSDNTSTTTAATFPMHVGSRGLIRSNTVHNLIIKDGHGHRIIQCVGLDEPRTLRRKTSSFEDKDLFQEQQQQNHHDWSPPLENLDDVLFTTRQQQLDEQRYHQEQFLLIHQQQLQQQQLHNSSLMNDNTDTSSSDSSSNHTSSRRRIKRNDSAKSISSLCSGSPPITSYDSKFDKLRNKLDKERAIVKALQKQKEACNKDVLFLSKSVDDLTSENAELKKKFENEKVLKERFQDDLSSTMDKLNEATEHIRQLENQTKILKSEIDDKDKNIRELEKQKQQQPSLPKGKPSYSEGKSTDRLLAAQLLHSQNQVRLLKSTMEQFLRMGVFNDDLHTPNVTSPTTSIETVASDFRSVGRSRQRRPSSHANKSSTTCASEDIPASPPVTLKSRKSLVPTDTVIETADVNKTTKTPEKKLKNQQEETMAELDIQFRELLREKEILQAEYSKAPSSGGNALVRRRREELESRLDTVDSQMCRIKLQMRSRNIL